MVVHNHATFKSNVNRVSDKMNYPDTYFQRFLSFMFVVVCLSLYLDCFIDISCTFRPFIVKFDISFYCYSIVRFCCCLTTLLLIYILFLIFKSDKVFILIILLKLFIFFLFNCWKNWVAVE